MVHHLCIAGLWLFYRCWSRLFGVGSKKNKFYQSALIIDGTASIHYIEINLHSTTNVHHVILIPKHNYHAHSASLYFM